MQPPKYMVGIIKCGLDHPDHLYIGRYHDTITVNIVRFVMMVCFSTFYTCHNTIKCKFERQIKSISVCQLAQQQQLVYLSSLIVFKVKFNLKYGAGFLRAWIFETILRVRCLSNCVHNLSDLKQCLLLEWCVARKCSQPDSRQSILSIKGYSGSLQFLREYE